MVLGVRGWDMRVGVGGTEILGAPGSLDPSVWWYHPPPSPPPSPAGSLIHVAPGPTNQQQVRPCNAATLPQQRWGSVTELPPASTQRWGSVFHSLGGVATERRVEQLAVDSVQCMDQDAGQFTLFTSCRTACFDQRSDLSIRNFQDRVRLSHLDEVDRLWGTQLDSGSRAANRAELPRHSGSVVVVAITSGTHANLKVLSSIPDQEWAHD